MWTTMVRRFRNAMLAPVVAAGVSATALAFQETAIRPETTAVSQTLRGGESLFSSFARRELPTVDGIQALAPEVRQEVERRLARTMPPSALPNPKDVGFPADLLAQARRDHEAAIIRLLGPSVAREAREFASQIRLFYEWEGYAEPPLDEAASAVDYLQAHPRTALRPYLQLFMLYRYRSAFEAATWEATQMPFRGYATRNADWVREQRDLQRRAAEAYTAVLNDVRLNPDVVVRAIAQDLDTREFLYVSQPPRIRVREFLAAR
jgi:hypothetical protein